jgi:hypothetical protein
MSILGRRLSSVPKALLGAQGPGLRSPTFRVRSVELLEDRALMSHGAHHVLAHDIHPLAVRQTRFVQTNLVSDGFVPAALTDPKLVNPWGLTASSTGPCGSAITGQGSQRSIRRTRPQA